ncbi:MULTISPECIES: hypothetical protein [Capnocytophaga]|uniref:Uncharacterized protein n=1 Tax=Capnocytophaga stomatis TaxID=1848904 RepID=A0A250FYG3_9FLAO|nr:MULTISPECIES: hypothetical protein [Capnocytophaga]ATA72795.1 hypothetical protein CGC49_05530 [Capnocytophaga sp. H4358]ATA90199.1 hypothetical protein CGC58_10960 [Capnocytophaga stomatis]GIJ95481.1 hypothetical protein CAPN001_00500 [Capnocytophaga stomatis]GIM49674.1 hypothetical protein CAPN003_11260 [Capnocytophaga stomatis]
MKNVKYVLLAGLLGFFSCNVKDSDPVEEDYEKLFPLKPIEKPENAYEDMRIRICNPDEALQNYRYPGVTLENQREYEITLKCRYREERAATKSRYVVRFVAADKSIQTVGSDASDNSLNFTMEKDKEFVFTYKVKSGFPMYLSVNGIGDRGSGVNASITAVSDDGLVVVPVLSVEQNQNSEGPNRIPQPYCEYIILP